MSLKRPRALALSRLKNANVFGSGAEASIPLNFDEGLTHALPTIQRFENSDIAVDIPMATLLVCFPTALVCQSLARRGAGRGASKFLKRALVQACHVLSGKKLIWYSRVPDMVIVTTSADQKSC